jgi:hypothetical protein
MSVEYKVYDYTKSIEYKVCAIEHTVPRRQKCVECKVVRIRKGWKVYRIQSLQNSKPVEYEVCRI